MTKVAVNKRNIIILVLTLAVVALIYWAYASRPNAEEKLKADQAKVMVYHNNTLKEEVMVNCFGNVLPKQ